MCANFWQHLTAKVLSFIFSVISWYPSISYWRSRKWLLNHTKIKRVSLILRNVISGFTTCTYTADRICSYNSCNTAFQKLLARHETIMWSEFISPPSLMQIQRRFNSRVNLIPLSLTFSSFSALSFFYFSSSTTSSAFCTAATDKNTTSTARSILARSTSTHVQWDTDVRNADRRGEDSQVQWEQVRLIRPVIATMRQCRQGFQGSCERIPQATST